MCCRSCRPSPAPALPRPRFHGERETKAGGGGGEDAEKGKTAWAGDSWKEALACSNRARLLVLSGSLFFRTAATKEAGNMPWTIRYQTDRPGTPVELAGFNNSQPT